MKLRLRAGHTGSLEEPAVTRMEAGRISLPRRFAIGDDTQKEHRTEVLFFIIRLFSKLPIDKAFHPLYNIVRVLTKESG